MGFSLALGALPKVLLQGVLKPVLSRLAQLASTVQETESKFAEARRDAIRAIARCVCVHACVCGVRVCVCVCVCVYACACVCV